MIPYIGDFAEDATVYHYFNTFDSNDPSASVTITNLVDADLKVHKDGSTTQATTDGATISIDFDSITGSHLVTIDTSADAYYVTGSDYMVRMEGTTVDGATINAALFTFSIENRFNDVNVASIAANAITATAIASNAITAAKIATDAITAAKIAADAIGASELAAGAVTEIQSGLATASALSTAQTDLDTITGSDGVTLATTQGNYAPGTAAELAKVPKSDGTATWNATALASINAEADTAISDYDPPTRAELTSDINGLNDLDAAGIRSAVGMASADLDTQLDALPTAAENADAVWDEDATGHQTGGTFGQAIGDPGANTETMYDAVVTNAAGTNVAADVIAVKSETATIQTEVEKITTTAHTEPSGVPAANEAPIDKLGYLFMALRNQVDVTATKKTFYDDGGAAEWEKDLSDDGTTYSESEGNAI